MKEKIDALHRQIIQVTDFLLDIAVRAFSIDKENWLTILNDIVNIYQKLYQLPAEIVSIVPETKDNTSAFSALRDAIDDIALPMFMIVKGSNDTAKAQALIYLTKRVGSLPLYVDILLPTEPTPEEEDHHEQL